ncbi:MAG: NAD(P)-dependent oxidoreductase [Chloroflexota bacterium]
MSSNTTNVLLLDDFKEERIQQLTELLDPRIKILTDQQTTAAHILIGGHVLTEEALSQNQDLKAAIIPWAGIPDRYYNLLSRPEFSHIIPHNCHYHSGFVAEYAFSMMLALAKDLGRKERSLRQGDWHPRYRPSRAMIMANKTVLIMGYGAIGQEIGRLCRALGMQVLATRRKITEPEHGENETVYPANELQTLLPTCDVLINALPLTPDTEGLIGAEEIAQLKSTALIINIGRAKTFDEAALYEALVSDQILGAAFDVWYRYPENKLARAATFPSAYPFHQLENMLLSPHNSAALLDNEHLDYQIQSLAEMLNSYAATGVLPNRVDLDQGY